MSDIDYGYLYDYIDIEKPEQKEKKEIVIPKEKK